VRPALCAALAILCGCTTEAPPPPAPPAELFRDAAAETGLQFVHNPFPSGKHFLPEVMGSGGALFDYDNDGDLDVFLIQNKPLEPGGPVPPQLGNRLYRNELVPSGKLRFVDVTPGSGLGAVMYGMGAATGDFDSDGLVDLYVTAFGPNALYRNNGDGTFDDVTAAAGVQDDRWSTAAAWFDYDRDGDLDLFFLNYVDFTPASNKQCQSASGEPDFCTPKAYHPVPARLFRNDTPRWRKARFTDVSAPSGIASAYGPGLGVTAVDVNNDGWLDLFVANDTHANLLWVNQKDGTFREEGLTTGGAYSEDGLAKAGMGVSAGDFDNDGDEDVFVVNLAREGATLFVNDAGSYQDQSLRYGLRPATFAFTGFGAGWFDYDNDGLLDIFIANGAVTKMESLRGRPWPFQQKNNLLRNTGSKFEEVGPRAGPAFAAADVSRGAAFGDVDNDGDVDILVTNNNGPVRLLLNQSDPANGWLMVSVDALPGTRVTVRRKDAPALLRRVRTDASYLSASDPRVHFGLGSKKQIDAILVDPPAKFTVRSAPGVAAPRR
jgi:hypothetical protein